MVSDIWTITIVVWCYVAIFPWFSSRNCKLHSLTFHTQHLRGSSPYAMLKETECDKPFLRDPKCLQSFLVAFEFDNVISFQISQQNIIFYPHSPMKLIFFMSLIKYQWKLFWGNYRRICDIFIITLSPSFD